MVFQLATLRAVALALSLISLASAATADDWRSRSIYQLITDRFAPATPNAPCNTQDRVYCGGTYATIQSKLDYIQQLGFDAIWISPTALNINETTVYGQAYHGYWTTDPTQLNPRFGSSDDLKALAAALHARDMYLMVDIAINALCSVNHTMTDAALATAEQGTLLFKKAADYHPPCSISWGNHTSEQQCWLAESGVALMDLNQDVNEVYQGLLNWIKSFTAEYNVDGLRIDASKHMTKQFNHDFCNSAGVFCTGEVAGTDTTYAGTYQGSDGIPSVFNFGLMYAAVNTFIDGYSLSYLQTAMNTSNNAYSDPTVITSFVDNQDLPRIGSLTSDQSLLQNILVFTFFQAGIPVLYYGTEQGITFGSGDPDNRAALWLYNNYSTSTPLYVLIKTLNAIRKNLGAGFIGTTASVKSIQSNGIALLRDGVLIVLTNKGSSFQGTWTISSAFSPNAQVIDLLSCSTLSADGSGALTVTWTNGQAFVFTSTSQAATAGVCGSDDSTATNSSASAAASSTGGVFAVSGVESAASDSTSSTPAATSGTDTPLASSSGSSDSVASTLSGDNGASSSNSVSIASVSTVSNSASQQASGLATPTQVSAGGVAGSQDVGGSVPTQSASSSLSGATSTGDGSSPTQSSSISSSGSAGSASGGSSTCKRSRKRGLAALTIVVWAGVLLFL